MTETSPPSTSGANKPTKTFSCVRCFERKVKCDKEHPCGGCVRSGVECVFRVPPPPRRKKKRTQEDILSERLNQYEQILKSKGIDVQKVAAENERVAAGTGTSSGTSSGHQRSTSQPGGGTLGFHSSKSTRASGEKPFVSEQLIYDQEGRSRYLDNNLWTRVTEEFNATRDALDHTSDEEDVEDDASAAGDDLNFMLGLTPSSQSSRNMHPSPGQIMALWRIYLENVNPFSMLVHRPTLQASLDKAKDNLEQLPKGLEALMFAIYSCAILSMTETEVEDEFGEPRRRLLSRYQSGTKRSLSRAKFLGSSDLVVLQAFILHLLSMREVYDSRTLWTLSGVALRMAEGMGLHRDGTALGLPPFETQLRRRIWFQITTLDYRTAELAGSTKFKRMGLEEVTTRAPLNINDDDIWPGMKEAPAENPKITEMSFCCIRYEFSTFWTKRLLERTGGDPTTLWENYKSPKSIAEKDAAIDELEQILEEKYVRYCDPSIPIELMISVVARTAVNTMRMVAHHPRRWATEQEMPEGERQLMWKLCNKIVDGYLLCISSKQLRSFSWHTTFYFQWQALIYLLDCVRANPTMDGADDAWRLVNETFQVHPEFVIETKKPLNVAVGSLCLKAYSAREETFRREGRYLPAKPPHYIQQLRKQRDAAQAKQAARRTKAEAQTQSPSQQQPPRSNSSPSTVSTGDLITNVTPADTQHFAHHYPAQRPLPPLHTLSLDHQPKMHQPQQPQIQQQPPQQPVPFWFDSFNAVGSQLTGADMDWMMMQDPIIDQSNQMDWTQWDSLLQESGFANMS